MAKVCIGVPTYRRPAMLQRALESIVAQAHQDVSVVVSDNGNDPETAQVVRSFGPRFEYVGQPRNLGLVGNWNYLKSRDGGDYWAFLEDDNFWKPGHLAAALQALERYPSAGMSFCPCDEYFDVQGMLTPKHLFSPPPGQADVEILETPAANGVLWLKGSRCPSSSVVLRAEAARTLPDFDANLPFCHDYLQWARLALRGDVVSLPQANVVYTYHSANAVTAFNLARSAGRQMREVRRNIAQSLLGGTSTETLVEAIAAQLTNAEIAQLLPALMLRGGGELRNVAIQVWRLRPAARDYSGHTRVAKILGLGYMRFCNHVDRVLGRLSTLRRRFFPSA